MPSLIPGYEYDIFISYRHKDNEYEGWVNEFVDNLSKELRATFKEDISIYFDTNPHDGLLETHNVDKSLEGKLKCLIFIPIISQTYCDHKSFAWKHEFCAFNKIAKEDQFGRDIKLINGNVSSRILPVRIHDLDVEDKELLETELGGVLRAVDFIYKEPGVNRPLKSSDNKYDNQNRTDYRNQINKISNAIKEIIQGIIKPTPSSQTQTAASIHSAKTKKSIAVLAFANMSNDPEQEYFSDGMAEEILTSLAHLKDLKVAGRTSSFQFKGKNIDLREVGDKLGVSTVLEGSVRKQGNRVKINAQLISVENGYQLWSKQFDRSLDDVFAIQKEIARAITQKLKITLLQNEKLEKGKGFTNNKEAYDAYLKGRYFWFPRKLKESEQYFKQAIDLDPSFAYAYAGLSVTYVLFPFYRFGSPHESMPKAQEAAEKAIQANSSLAEPYASLAWKNFIYDWKPDEAKKYFEKALQINPKYSPIHYWYGQYLAYYGSNSTMAVVEMRKGLELDPLDPVAHFSLGVTLKQLNKLNEAIQAFKAAIEFNVEYSNAYVNMAYCYLGIGKTDEALKAFNKAAQLSNDWAQAALVYFYVNERKHDQAKAVFDQLMERSQTEHIPKSSLATAASFLGQKDLAHELLKKAFEARDTRLVHFKLFTVRLPNDLFSDPRNLELFEQFKLPNWQ